MLSENETNKADMEKESATTEAPTSSVLTPVKQEGDEMPQPEISSSTNGVGELTSLISTDKLSEHDYSNLFRGLSTFDYASLQSTVDAKGGDHVASDSQAHLKSNYSNSSNGGNGGPLGSETTYSDLSDLLLREQLLLSESKPAVATETPTTDKIGNFVLKRVLSGLSPVSFDSNRPITALTESSTCAVAHDNHVASSTDMSDSASFADSDEYSKSNASAEVSLQRAKKSSFELTRTTQRAVKRSPNESMCSMVSSSGLNESTPAKKPRGRRPLSSVHTESGKVPASTGNAPKLSKKQKLLEENKGDLVCFGNKVVKKNTDEYNKRRQSNNVAVKKCRSIQNQKQAEKERKMRELDEENRRLSDTVQSLSRELNVLKDIIIGMSPDKKLPDYLEKLVKDVEKI